MALIACKECNGQISDKAASCPTCGAPVVNTRRRARSALSVGFFWAKILVALLVGVVAFTTCSTLNASGAAQTSGSLATGVLGKAGPEACRCGAGA